MSMRLSLSRAGMQGPIITGVLSLFLYKLLLTTILGHYARENLEQLPKTGLLRWANRYESLMHASCMLMMSFDLHVDDTLFFVEIPALHIWAVLKTKFMSQYFP